MTLIVFYARVCICKSLLTIGAHFHRQRRFISLQKEGKRIVANNNKYTNVCVKISSTVAGSVCGPKSYKSCVFFAQHFFASPKMNSFFSLSRTQFSLPFCVCVNAFCGRFPWMLKMYKTLNDNDLFLAIYKNFFYLATATHFLYTMASEHSQVAHTDNQLLAKTVWPVCTQCILPGTFLRR